MARAGNVPSRVPRMPLPQHCACRNFVRVSIFSKQSERINFIIINQHICDMFASSEAPQAEDGSTATTKKCIYVFMLQRYMLRARSASSAAHTRLPPAPRSLSTDARFDDSRVHVMPRARCHTSAAMMAAISDSSDSSSALSQPLLLVLLVTLAPPPPLHEPLGAAVAELLLAVWLLW